MLIRRSLPSAILEGSFPKLYSRAGHLRIMIRCTTRLVQKGSFEACQSRSLRGDWGKKRGGESYMVIINGVQMSKEAFNARTRGVSARLIQLVYKEGKS